MLTVTIVNMIDPRLGQELEDLFRRLYSLVLLSGASKSQRKTNRVGERIGRTQK